MGNNRLRSTQIHAAPHEWRRHFHRGWVDAQNGRRWPDDYNAMSATEQLAYEQARLLIKEAMKLGFAIPTWRGDKAGCDPVEKLWNDVQIALKGMLIPPEVELAA